MKYIILWALMLVPFISLSQGTISGKVSDALSGELLPGANIYFLKSMKGSTTDTEGNFSFSHDLSGPSWLVCSYVGYKTDSLYLNYPKSQKIAFELLSINELGMVEVGAKESRVERINPMVIEKVTQNELRKAACCNLSETFENTATVDVSFSDAVTGTKKIRMLSLDGVYAQVLQENIPALRGIKANSGLASIPGPWMESIQLTKGLGSIVNGFDAVSGQINVEFHKPHKINYSYVELYMNEMGRVDLSHFHPVNLGEKWFMLNMINTSISPFANDRNNDGFREQPVGGIVNLISRVERQGTRHHGLYGVKYSREEKEAGTISEEGAGAYRLNIEEERINISAKNGFFLNPLDQSIGWITNINHDKKEQTIPQHPFKAEQTGLYTTLVFSDELGKSIKYRAGLSYILDSYVEELGDIERKRTESIPGVLTEWTAAVSPKLSALLGLRFDQHNLFGSWITPRVNLKWDYAATGSLRLSGGIARRSPLYVSESLNWLVSSRQVSYPDKFDFENTIAFGANWLQRHTLFGLEGTLTVDVNVTNFSQRLIFDVETPTELNVRFTESESGNLSIQAEQEFDINKHWELRFAYKYNEANIPYFEGSDITKMEPLISKHFALINLQFNSSYEKWVANGTLRWTGPKRLPVSYDQILSLPSDGTFSNMSDDYYLLALQVTRKFKTSEFFFGGENILNFKQKGAIRGSSDPYGPAFDAAMVWGPLGGRTLYFGMRFEI